MTEIRGRDKFFPSKYGRSNEVESSKPNYLILAEEANEKFGKDLGDDTLLEEITDYKGVVGEYINGISDVIERKKKKNVLTLCVGIARRIGLQTVGEVREKEESELQNLILERLSKKLPYKIASVYLKNIFHRETSED